MQYGKFVQFIFLMWAIALAIYWLISGAQLAHLYDTFCEERNHACDGTIQKFILLPIMGFFCMGAWVSTTKVYNLCMAIGYLVIVIIILTIKLATLHAYTYLVILTPDHLSTLQIIQGIFSIIRLIHTKST